MTTDHFWWRSASAWRGKVPTVWCLPTIGVWCIATSSRATSSSLTGLAQKTVLATSEEPRFWHRAARIDPILYAGRSTRYTAVYVSGTAERAARRP